MAAGTPRGNLRQNLSERRSVLLTNLLQSLVHVVDVYMVGRLGPIPIAAVGMSTAIHLLSALSHRLGLTLAQVAVPGETNELGVIWYW